MLRIDLEGIGESGPDGFGLLTNPALYSERRTTQMITILDWLQSRGLADHFVLGGVCSGAYWSLHAAVADPRVVAALLINLYAFRYSEELEHERDAGLTITKIRRRGMYRALHGKLAGTEAKSMLALLRPGRLRAGSRRPAERGQLGYIEADFDVLRERDVYVLLMLSRGEPLEAQMARHGPRDIPERWPNVRLGRSRARIICFGLCGCRSTSPTASTRP